MGGVLTILRAPIAFVETLGSITGLLFQTLYWATVGPFRGQTRIGKFIFGLCHQIGVKSFFIVSLTSFLVGAILVLQTADKFEEFGSKDLVAGVVCIAIVRELGPLMTAIVLAGRVGAAFTAGIGSMVINEEVLALKTMGVNPVGFLVAPRFIAICLMQPVLTAFSYVVGIAGGLVVGTTVFQLPMSEYIANTEVQLGMADLWAGLAKAVVFGAIICMVSCYYAFNVRGGPEGVGRNTMISVVHSLITIIIADAVITIVMAVYVY